MLHTCSRFSWDSRSSGLGSDSTLWVNFGAFSISKCNCCREDCLTFYVLEKPVFEHEAETFFLSVSFLPFKKMNLSKHFLPWKPFTWDKLSSRRYFHSKLNDFILRLFLLEVFYPWKNVLIKNRMVGFMCEPCITIKSNGIEREIFNCRKENVAFQKWKLTPNLFRLLFRTWFYAKTIFNFKKSVWSN